MYCTITDISQAIGGDIPLAEYSCDDAPPIINTEYIDRLISKRSNYIDDYLRARYELPLINEHGILTDICVSLVKFDLMRRRNNESLMTDEYNTAIDDLEKIRARTIILDESSEESASTIGGMAVSRKHRHFSRRLLNDIFAV
jgi:phage gp36-like protein